MQGHEDIQFQLVITAGVHPVEKTAIDFTQGTAAQFRQHDRQLAVHGSPQAEVRPGQVLDDCVYRGE